MAKLKRRDKSKITYGKKKRTHSQIGRSNKSKGAKFEREICQRLTRWITGRERPEIYWRSSLSGGRQTILQKGKLIKARGFGDLVSIHTTGQWLLDYYGIECKHVAKVDFSFFLEGKGNLYDWWEKATQQAMKANRVPLLIFKQNASNKYIALHYDSALWKEFDLSGRSGVVINAPLKAVHIFTLDDFLNTIAPKALHRLIQLRRTE